MYNKIIIPINTMDELQGNKKVIDTVKTMVTADTTVQLLHIMEPLPNYVALQVPGFSNTNVMEEATVALQELADGADYPAEAVIHSGDPARKILEVAQQEKADLIVMAASSRSGLEAYLLGSTTARVSRRADCSVLVVR